MRSKVMWAAIILFSTTTLVACRPSQRVNAAANETEPQLQLDEAQPGQEAAEMAPAKPKKAAASVKAAAAPKAVTPATSPKPLDPAPEKAEAPASESRPAAAKQDDVPSVATTISGCLVHDGDEFQLKDTDGEHAPRARSWKSGFIKRSAARVTLLDPANRLKLASHVGYRVSASGTLSDREMEPRWVQATSKRCD